MEAATVAGAKRSRSLAPILVPHATILTPERERLVAIIRERPWITVSDLMTASGLGWGTIDYHLGILTSASIVRRIRKGRRCFLVLSSAQLADDSAMHSALKPKTGREIALAILETPGATIDELVKRLDMSPRVVYYHVSRLVQAGLVLKESETRLGRLTPAESLRQSLLPTTLHATGR